MEKIINKLLLTCFLLSAAHAQSQFNCTASNGLRDSLPVNINLNEASVKKAFPYKTFIVPSAMVVFGVLSIQSHPLWPVNEKLKEEVYTERTSTTQIHLDNFLPFIPALAVYGLNAAGIPGKNNFRDRTMILGLSGLIMGGTVFAVKSFSGETRPDGSDQYSFPSGHTAAAFATAEFLRQEYRNISPWYGIAGYGMAAATGYLRMYNNKHWMGDVVAGAGIGIMSTKLAYWIYPIIKKKLFRDREVNTVIMPTFQSGSFGVGMVHRF